MKFVTEDGKQFKTMEEAQKHEKMLKESAKKKEEKETKRKDAEKLIQEKSKELEELILNYQKTYGNLPYVGNITFYDKDFGLSKGFIKDIMKELDMFHPDDKFFR